MSENNRSHHSEALAALRNHNIQDPLQDIGNFNYAVTENSEVIAHEHITYLQLALEDKGDSLIHNGTVMEGAAGFQLGIDLIQASSTPVATLDFIAWHYHADAQKLYDKAKAEKATDLQHLFHRYAEQTENLALNYEQLRNRLYPPANDLS